MQKKRNKLTLAFGGLMPRILGIFMTTYTRGGNPLYND